jgi:hypothetical protein
MNGLVVASPSEITMAGVSTNGGENQLAMVNSGLSGLNDLEYLRTFGLDLYIGEVNNLVLWETSNPSMGGTDPWVIAVASVPEPSTLTLAALGVFSGLVYGMTRKRGAGSEVTSLRLAEYVAS